jgi:hypothetical protein
VTSKVRSSKLEVERIEVFTTQNYLGGHVTLCQRIVCNPSIQEEYRKSSKKESYKIVIFSKAFQKHQKRRKTNKKLQPFLIVSHYALFPKRGKPFSFIYQHIYNSYKTSGKYYPQFCYFEKNLCDTDKGKTEKTKKGHSMNSKPKSKSNAMINGLKWLIAVLLALIVARTFPLGPRAAITAILLASAVGWLIFAAVDKNKPREDDKKEDNG